MNYKKKHILIIFCWLLASAWSAALYAAQEYRIKAAILYNLARMVEWPEEALSGMDSPLVICFIGKDPFAEALDMIRNKKVRNHPLEFKKDIALEDARQCAMLFLCPSESERLDEILTAVNALPVLTVSDQEGFAQRGVVANLVPEEKKIRIDLNVKAAERAHLSLNPTLLELAVEVEDQFSPVP